MVIDMRRLAYLSYRVIGRLFVGMSLALGFASALASRQESTVHTGTSVKPYADKDTYSIYAILLENKKSSSLVIQSETDLWWGATPENMGIKGDKNFQKVWGIVLVDFANQYQNPKLLTRDIPLEIPYELLSKQKIDSIFKSEGGWETFYKRYPSSGGFFSFSLVGFDPQKNHAVVWMYHSCGYVCGDGEPHFFEKKDGKWREVSVNAEVTVSAS
jgi:hypothetical protein